MAGEFPVDPHRFDLNHVEVDFLAGLEGEDCVVGSLRDAIDELPEHLRDVINGLFYERATRTEIAARLGVHRTYVERYRLEALRQLRDLLRRDGVGEVPAGGD